MLLQFKCVCVEGDVLHPFCAFTNQKMEVNRDCRFVLVARARRPPPSPVPSPLPRGLGFSPHFSLGVGPRRQDRVAGCWKAGPAHVQPCSDFAPRGFLLVGNRQRQQTRALREAAENRRWQPINPFPERAREGVAEAGGTGMGVSRWSSSSQVACCERRGERLR